MKNSKITDQTEQHKWHAMDLQEVLGTLQAQADGLSQSNAEERLRKYGSNTLEEQQGTSLFGLLFRQVNNPLIYLLFVAAFISVLAKHIMDAAIILIIIALNTILGFLQEWHSEGALAALKKMISPHARIIRDGQIKTIDASQVVPGDILVLETGDRVAADARLLQSDDLYIDESALTGESEPVNKVPQTVSEDAPLGDRRNMVWMSTNVTGGRGKAIVTSTGMDSQMGSIAGQVSHAEQESTPLQKRIHSLSIFLGIAGVSLAAIVVGLGLLRGYETVDMLLYGVAVAVSAIPEGLPAVITITLALGVRRMASHNALMRRLPTVETLGSTTVICTDKTGTLTENQMTVKKIWAGRKAFNVTGEGYQPEGEFLDINNQPVKEIPEAIKDLLRVGIIANNAHLRKQDDSWHLEGNPSEGALLAAASKAHFDLIKTREDANRINEIPFSSDQKYMAVLVSDKADKRTAFVKGAPDRILNYCSSVMIDDEPVELTNSIRKQINEVIDDFAKNALRVLAGGFKELEQGNGKITNEDVEQGLTLLGLWGIIDPPRSQSAPAVEAAKEAGIRTVMITGDYAATALAIAKQVKIAGDETVLGSKDIDEMDETELAEATLRSGVFARVSPSHKLKIMKALKKIGHIVAMTGDGVNDAPALKGADIGISMGQTGTEVAKEASDMILTDDNFATIVHAVEEGRVIFSNIRRVVFFLLATNMGEVLTLGAALMFGLPLPLTAAMVLWVNLVTDSACNIPLGIEPRHQDVLKMPPRDPKEHIINRTILLRMSILTPIMASGTLLLFWYEIKAGSLDHARTIAFTTLAVFQWFQALNARSQYLSIFSIGLFSNRWLLLGIGFAIILQIFAVHTPVGHWMFGTVHLTWFDWLLIILVSASIWIIDEIAKLLKIYGRPEKTTK